MKFDINTEVRVRIHPMKTPETSEEEFLWHKAEDVLNFEAKLLAKSFEVYFEKKASLLIDGIKTKEILKKHGSN